MRTGNVTRGRLIGGRVSRGMVTSMIVAGGREGDRKEGDV